MKEKTWPAGSPEEYVQYEAEYTSASTFDGMKENIDMFLEAAVYQTKDK